MKAKLLVILLISISLSFIACSEDSVTEAVLGSNSITLSGDFSDSFDAQSIAGFSADDSVFTFMMSQNISDDSYENTLMMWKQSSTLPTVGTYNVSFNDDYIGYNADDFYGAFGINDTTFYQMESGTVKITTSSSTKIEGTFDMSGQTRDFFNNPSGQLNVVGKFSSVPLDL